jgi:hypothetical protein
LFVLIPSMYVLSTIVDELAKEYYLLKEYPLLSKGISFAIVGVLIVFAREIIKKKLSKY